MSFCVTTEMWWPVNVECKCLFCLLCKKHDTTLKISRKFLTRSPVNDFTQKSLKITAVRHNIWTQFQRRCYRGIPCFKEPLTNAKELQKMCCWRCSQLRIGSWRKSYLTTRSSHMWAPKLACIPGLGGFAFCLLLHRLAVRISLPFHIFLQV